MRKYRGIIIRRLDRTVEPDPKTKQYPHAILRVRVNNDIVPTHRMLKELR